MRDMCDGAMHVVGNWGFGRKCVCVDARERMEGLVATYRGLVAEESRLYYVCFVTEAHCSVVLFSLSFWEILRVFLD